MKLKQMVTQYVDLLGGIRMTNWKEEMKKVNQCPQRQDSTFDQLLDLYKEAIKLGFYDGDILKCLIEGK